MIWVIGCNGMLGTELCRQLKKNNFSFTGTDRSVDVTDFVSLSSFAEGKDIKWIVNCSAYTAVDKAEEEKNAAFNLNVKGPENIAKIAKKLGAKLIHISTDYVFDGNGIKETSVVDNETSVVEPVETTIRPYKEDDPIAPIGVYGRTKALGEKRVSDNLSEFYILRTAWLYGWDGKNFVYTMIRAMQMRESVKVVNDQRGSPTFCGDLADVIQKIILADDGKKVPYGIYNVTDMGEITWWDFTNEIKKQALELGIMTNSSCAVNPCTSAEYPTPAKRPAYSVLSKDKINRVLGQNMPDWKDSLHTFLHSELFDKSRIE